jgi:ABC-type lipoprotein export system ATPase subunit
VPALAVTDLAVAHRDAGVILGGVSLSLAEGAIAAITGPSGAGKTTLLHAVAGLAKPSAGSVRWGEREISALGESERAAWRREVVGLVFQDFQLVAELDMLGNVLLPLAFDRWRVAAAERQRAAALLHRMGLEALSRRASALSRGEQQRVALARALIRRPSLLLADEPTASLDPQSGARAAALLIDAAREAGASLLIVSHDRAVLDRIPTLYRLEGGRLIQQGGAHEPALASLNA